MKTKTREFNFLSAATAILLSVIISYTITMILIVVFAMLMPGIQKYESYYKYLSIALQCILGFTSSALSAKMLNRYLFFVMVAQIPILLIPILAASLTITPNSFGIADFLPTVAVISSSSFAGLLLSRKKSHKAK